MENVACEKCIEAYKLPKKILGKEGDICYWCCVKIRDLEKRNREMKVLDNKFNKLIKR